MVSHILKDKKRTVKGSLLLYNLLIILLVYIKYQSYPYMDIEV